MSAPCVPTSPHHFRLIATPLVSFWFCMTTSMSFHARRHAILSPFQYTFAPFDPPCLTFISSIFLLSPFPSPHLSTFNSPHPLVIRLISIPSHEQKRCTKSNFLFIFFALKHATHATQASILCVDYLCIYSPRWYLSRTSERRVSGCCLGSGRKGRRDIIAGIKN